MAYLDGRRHIYLSAKAQTLPFEGGIGSCTLCLHAAAHLRPHTVTTLLAKRNAFVSPFSKTARSQHTIFIWLLY